MASSLDDEIEHLQARAASLKKQLRLHVSTLITAPSTLQLLTSQDNPQPTLTLPLNNNNNNTKTTVTPATKKSLLAHSALQQAHTQQCLYRACASITTFRARDPDPKAVDGGAILGLRIEVVSRGKFLRPYYVLLNRPYGHQNEAHGDGGGGGGRDKAGKTWLRVHRHTLPACISLAGLAARYLAAPSSNKEGKKKTEPRKTQDLARFARALRREVVRYHHRLGVVAELRKAAGLGGRKGAGGDEDGGAEGGVEGEGEASARQPLPNRLVDITPADAEAKHITIEWADGRTGRLVMGDDGEIVKLVVVGENGRDREAGRELLGGAVRVDDVARRLAAMV
ncbi:Cenp-O kinetochore centromere component [Madurella fahalii]|uniref:Cenp-O kinetochore centromere component n=1 Tax=Madurella fahalii TaxID=1157608 RepID=A0ABQ0G382_9PEZI